MTNSKIVIESTPSLQESITLALQSVRGMLRFKWTALAIAWAMALCIWLLVLTLPDTYKASARVYVDTDSVLRPLLRGLTVETDVESDVAVMTRIMTSRPILEEVIRQADLDLTIRTPLEMEGLLKSLENRIEIAGSTENLYEISFVDRSRETALNVVRKLMDTFVNSTLGSGQDDARQAEEALEKEIADYERRLRQAEDRLAAFKRKNVGLMPGDRGDYFQQLQAALEAQKQARKLVEAAEHQVSMIERKLHGETPVVGIMSSGIGGTAWGRTTSVDGAIASAEQRLEELLRVYTDKHPAVVRTKTLLEDLHKQREEELRRMPVADAEMPLEANPVYQSLKVQHNSVMVELINRRQDLAVKDAEVERLESLVDVIPQVESELARLNRDYDVIKDRYETMLARWEDLQTAKRVQAGTEGVKFQIIDPPFASSRPAGPNRPLFIVAGLIFGLGAGVAVAFGLNLLKPVYLSMKDLAPTGLPVLGSIQLSLSAQDAARRLRSGVLLASAALGLVLACVFAIAFADAGAGLLRSLTA